MLICLDDLHWAGDARAAAMRQLPEQLAALPVGWVMAFRPNQGPPLLQSAKEQMEDEGAEVIRLGPLGREAVREIATDVLGAEPDYELLQKADQVGGDPFLLVEFFRGLQDERNVRVEGGRATLLEDRMPRRISDDMRIRLLRMSQAAYRMATLARRLAGCSPSTSWLSWQGCRYLSCWNQSKTLSRPAFSWRAATGWHSRTT